MTNVYYHSKTSLNILAIGLLLALLSACTFGFHPSGAGLERTKGHIEFQGHARVYSVLTPEDIQEGETYPLVLALHGGGGDGKRMCALRGGIQELAAQEKFIVLCPSGIDRHWNDGRNIDRWRAHAENIDDVGFLLALVSRISGQFPVDTKRIYVTGMSNGGKMSLRLACEAPGTFRAAAAVIASLPAALDCEPSSSISIMVMNGTDDPLIPWEGGDVKAFGKPLGKALSTPETVSFWVERNLCDPDPDNSNLPDVEPSDESWIGVARYGGCVNSEQVALYTVHGAGHTWPGGSQYLPEVLIGRTNRDANAAQLIWDFFANLST
ncbi:MAG: PHB depolymerase family esterase [Anaerolineales bacterium]